MKIEPELIYVAGPLNAPNAVEYIKNLHIMISVANEIKKKGHYPYVPCLDILLGLLAGNWEYTDYAGGNLPYVDACQSLFRIAPSPGTNKEVRRARKLRKKMYYDLEEIPDAKRQIYKCPKRWRKTESGD